MAKKLPYIPFFTGDWIKDQAVSLCTPATRGVWIDLLCAMHDAGRLGELRGTHEQLARLARCSTADISLALTDLQTTEAADVTERNGVVTVINRRMKREAEQRLKNAQRQEKFRALRGSNGSVTPYISDSVSISDSPNGESINPQTPLPEIDGEPIEIPPNLDCNEVRRAIIDWLVYKADTGKPYKRASYFVRKLNEFVPFGPLAFVQSVNASIGNNWAGIFPPKERSNGKPRTIRGSQSFDPKAGNDNPGFGKME